MKLGMHGMQVGLGPGHIVLDGDPPKGQPPNFRPISVATKWQTYGRNCYSYYSACNASIVARCKMCVFSFLRKVVRDEISFMSDGSAYSRHVAQIVRNLPSKQGGNGPEVDVDV